MEWIVSHPNIALIKYFGKRDQELNLPATDSVGLNLSEFYTKTRVVVKPASKTTDGDVVVINGQKANRTTHNKAFKIFSYLREKTGEKIVFLCESVNNFPERSGFASSSSGFSALTKACFSALDLETDTVEMAKVSRLASGSSARSFFPGFAYLLKNGECGSFYPVSHLPMMAVTITVSVKIKKVSSTQAMKIVERFDKTYEKWLKDSETQFETAKACIEKKDFLSLKRVCEENLASFHSLLLESGINYFSEKTFEIIKFLKSNKKFNSNIITTTDAGANIIVFVKKEFGFEFFDEIFKVLSERFGVKSVLHSLL